VIFCGVKENYKNLHSKTFIPSFTDSDATLIYFYGPIAMTLVANTVLLLSAKQARFAKLQRLEKGPSKPPSNSKARLAIFIC
jgi:hypothetical protein